MILAEGIGGSLESVTHGPYEDLCFAKRDIDSSYSYPSMVHLITSELGVRIRDLVSAGFGS